nr:hypothetical protein CFP56_28769 [Quercus suber]
MDVGGGGCRRFHSSPHSDMMLRWSALRQASRLSIFAIIVGAPLSSPRPANLSRVLGHRPRLFCSIIPLPTRSSLHRERTYTTAVVRRLTSAPDRPCPQPTSASTESPTPAIAIGEPIFPSHNHIQPHGFIGLPKCVRLARWYIVRRAVARQTIQANAKRQGHPRDQLRACGE